MADAREILTFDDRPPPPGESPWVNGAGPGHNVQVVASDSGWAAQYASLAQTITEAVGEHAIGVEHIGSTSVPGLPAKPVIDIDLTVGDSADEPTYVPALENCGFVLVIREPWWSEHRCLRGESPLCNLHVFSKGSAELDRHRIFRDWLRSTPEDHALYANAKLRAAEETRAGGGHTMDYNARKQTLILEIYDRAFRARGLVD